MSRALSPSFARCYGLARVARVWKISRASVYRSLKETPPNTITRRPGPVGACSDAELADHNRRRIDATFQDNKSAPAPSRFSRRRLLLSLGPHPSCYRCVGSFALVTFETDSEPAGLYCGRGLLCFTF
jgi:hypothetical protein